MAERSIMRSLRPMDHRLRHSPRKKLKQKSHVLCAKAARHLFNCGASLRIFRTMLVKASRRGRDELGTTL